LAILRHQPHLLDQAAQHLRGDVAHPARSTT
jgi:hypothetical protein